MEKVIKSKFKMPVPKLFRRMVRSIKKARRGYAINPSGKPKGSSHFNIIGVGTWNPQAIFYTKRKKLKGWQKNRRA